MAMIIEQGVLTLKGEVQSGTTKNGNGWSSQTIVVDIAGYGGAYRKVALRATTAQVQELESIPVGSPVTVTYQVTAREYQGLWYNNVNLYSIEKTASESSPAAAPETKTQEADLPF